MVVNPGDKSYKKSLFLKWMDQHRNIYENAELIPQNRLDPNEFEAFFISNKEYKNRNKVADFLFQDDVDNELWKKKNEEFLNYHKSLNPSTFFNSIAIDHYIGLQTGLNEVKHCKVLDIGGGTGHFLCSFFKFPETIEYFLLDPNIRLLHDHFVRMYPRLLDLQMRQVRATAEDLPFKQGLFDLIVCSSAIDHMADVDKFIIESIRCLSSNGKILLSSHLSGANAPKSSGFNLAKPFEFAARMFHRLSNRVSRNDHTNEIKSVESLVVQLESHGLKVSQSESFKHYFFIVAEKV